MDKLKLIKDMDLLEDTFREQVKGIFSKGDSVAVKLHMGEKYNKFYLRPRLIKILVGVLKEYGVRPFLFDSVVLYAGSRDTVEGYYQVAEEHGFTEEEIGCPIVVSNKGTVVKTKDLNVHVCKELADADGMLVVSHVKGHGNAGFGAAIKNIGMGGVTTQSKAEIHKAESAEFDDLLAQGAYAVLKAVGKKVFFVNFLINISKECDCCNNPGPLVADDIGVLFGRNILAVDKASLDLVNEQKPDIFKKLHNHDPCLQINYITALGTGDDKYVIG